ncbi:putative ribonuclease H-like domain-containing protein [Tanacetum coccineum]
MYSFNLENIVPTRGLACLVAKATVDESNKWHRRLSHVNFKNLNKLVKGNLPVTAENKANKIAGPEEANNSPAQKERIEVKSLMDTGSKTNEEPLDQADQAFLEELKRLKRQEKEANDAVETIRKEFAQVNIASPSRNVSVARPTYPILSNYANQDDSQILGPEDIYKVPSDEIFTSASDDDEGAVDDFTNFKSTMNEELMQFKTQKVWILFDLPFGKKAIRTKWVYRNKKDERGVIVRNKARIEAIRIFLAFASYIGFIVYHMDVKSAFLYGIIDEKFYVSQPLGFIDPKFPKKVYNIVKALYGLHQAPRAWYATLSTFLVKSRYRGGTINKIMFVKKDKKDIMLVKQKEDGIFISQDKYVAEILKKFYFMSIKTASTPIETQKPLVKDEEAADVDVTPKTSHLHAMKRIFRYLKGQPKLGLWYPKELAFDLEAYSDSDYARANLDSKSTTRGCQFLDRRLISWQCKKQIIMATSTTVAEYVAAANCCRQVLWIQNQMLDYRFNFMNTKIYIDNESTICIVNNPVFHSKTKHIKIRYHFIRDTYEKKLIQVLKIHTDDNVADLLTKAFDVSSILSIEHIPDPTYTFPQTSMADLEFFNQHNMVACLEKTEGNTEFHEIVDFLTSSLVHFALTQIHASVDSKAVVVTEASKRNSFLFNDVDGTTCLTNEAILQNLALMGKGLKFSGTVTPLFPSMLVQNQAHKGEGSGTHTEHQPTPSVTQPSVLDLQQYKDAQAAEILQLKTRIKKLEKKCKKEFVSKQGRKNAKPGPTLDDSAFDDLDANLAHGMDYMKTEEAMNEGRTSSKTEELNITNDTMIIEEKGIGEKGGSTEDLVSTDVPNDSTDPPIPTTVFQDEDIFLVDALVMLSDKTKLKGVEIKEMKDTDRPARSVLTLKPLPTIDPKDKGKEILEEEPEPVNVKSKGQDEAQIAMDEEVTRQLHEQIQVTLERERVAEEEATNAALIREYDEIQARINADTQRKFIAEQRAAAIRNKPPTKSQLRTQMMTYLRHVGGYKHAQLHRKNFEEIQVLYERQKKFVQDFVPIGSAEDKRRIEEMSKKATGKDTSKKQKVLKEPDGTKVEVKQDGAEESTRKTPRGNKEVPKIPGRRLQMKATKNLNAKDRLKILKKKKHLKTFS